MLFLRNTIFFVLEFETLTKRKQSSEKPWSLKNIWITIHFWHSFCSLVWPLLFSSLKFQVFVYFVRSKNIAKQLTEFTQALGISLPWHIAYKNLKYTVKYGTVVVAQLEERLIPIPELRGGNFCDEYIYC